MARKDTIHDAVKNALIADDWTITHDPIIINIVDTRIEADLAAEKVVVAEKEKIKIIVEVKSFSQPSIINTFYTAFGQYLAYRDAMAENQIDRAIYLGISEETYDEFNKISFIKRRLNQYNIKIIVVDIEEEIITQWIE